MKNIKNLKLPFKHLIVILVISLAVAGAFFVGKKYLKPQPKKIYEVMVQARDQYNSDPAEDIKNSLKIGDAIVVLPEGHNWSDTERGSYLIVKMNLTEEEAQLLLAPDSKTETIEVSGGTDGPSAGSTGSLQAGSGRAKLEKQEQQTILRARRYRLKTEEMNIRPEDFLGGSTLGGRVFDWGVVEKKTKL